MKAERDYDFDDRSEYVKSGKKKMKRRDDNKIHHRKSKRDYLDESFDEYQENKHYRY